MLLDLFELEAFVGLALLAIVIFVLGHALLAERHRHREASSHHRDLSMRDIVFVAIVIAFFLLAALFVRICEAIVGPTHEQVDE